MSLKFTVVLLQRIVYMGMGHRLKEEHYKEYPFKSEVGPFEHGNGTYLCAHARVRACVCAGVGLI